MRDRMVSTAALLKGTGPTVSATTRKRQLASSATELESMGATFDAVVAQVEGLHQWSVELRDHVKSSEGSRADAMRQLESVAQDMQDTLARLSRVESERDDLQNRLDKLTDQLQVTQQELGDARVQLRARAQAAGGMDARLRAAQERADEAVREAAHHRMVAQEAQAARQDAEGSVAAIVADRDRAKGAAERAQRAVAGVAADNVVLVMRARKLEEELQAVTRERDELQLAADEQRGPYFEQVRVEVEGRVTDAMERAVELEREMERQHRAFAEERDAWRVKLGELEGELAEALERESALSGALASSRATEEAAVAARAAADAARDEQHSRAEAALAECRVLRDNDRMLRQESETARGGRAAAERERVAAERALAEARARIEALETDVEDLGSRLDTQRDVNKELLQRKGEVEWELVQALAAGSRRPRAGRSGGESNVQSSAVGSGADAGGATEATEATEATAGRADELGAASLGSRSPDYASDDEGGGAAWSTEGPQVLSGTLLRNMSVDVPSSSALESVREEESSPSAQSGDMVLRDSPAHRG
ncbi:unnamed protein product [Pedinophyceae sp. YPF-701]|nr:unnamed protein product [Pedinophyceae sp. YPF-701]